MRFNTLAILAGLLILAACSRGGSSETEGAANAATATKPTATASSGSVADAAGDAVMENFDPAPGYLDALSGTVTTQPEGAFVFTETLSAPVPETPVLPKGDVALGWSFCVDTDPNTAVAGFPLATIPMPCEFIVHTRWDGSTLSGLLIDRRPLVDGKKARTIQIDPVLGASSISESVSSTRLGDPSTFSWSMFTEQLGAFGTDIVYHVDSVPDGGVDTPVTWPSS
jgi:hypothetical protein